MRGRAAANLTTTIKLDQREGIRRSQAIELSDDDILTRETVGGRKRAALSQAYEVTALQEAHLVARNWLASLFRF